MANFTGTPLTGAIPLTVNFSDRSLGGPQSWLWDFGDGGSSTLENPSHAYTAIGTYTVKLTVTKGSYSNSLTKPNYIHATDPPPNTEFSGTPTTGLLPLDVSFTDLSTGPITSWSWTFGDGGTSTEQDPSHVYPNPGFYTVKLTATGPGGSDTEQKTSYIHVLAPVPSISVDLPEATMVGRIIDFTVTVTDPNSDIVSAKLLNPPPGLVLEPIVNQPSPATVKGRWMAIRNYGGLRQLVFEAFNATYPAEKSRLTVPVRVDLVNGSTNILLGDMTGDGVLDTIAADALPGATYLWVGKQTPDEAPTATFATPSGLKFGNLSGGQFLQLADVTGDGTLDLVTVAKNSGTTKDEIEVYAGGPNLSGTVNQTARLRDSTLSFPVYPKGGQSLLIGDVTGDGIDDVIAYGLQGSGGDSDLGQISVWSGGASMTGDRSTPTARLIRSTANNEDLCGYTGQTVLLVDMTGDGVLDIVTCADARSGRRGAVYVWQGGSGLVGSPPVWAKLYNPAAAPGDRMGVELATDYSQWGSAQAVEIGDVDGDGSLDVVAADSYATIGGVTSLGAIYVWSGNLAGTPPPTATLADFGFTQTEFMPRGTGECVLLMDLTGDGILDVVAASDWAQGLGLGYTGAVYLWHGGPQLAGNLSPSAILRNPLPGLHDKVPDGSVQCFYSSDVTGDGQIDLVVGAPFYGSPNEWGAVFVYEGGPALSGMVDPRAKLIVPQYQDRLGYHMQGHGIQLLDMNADGINDILTGSFNFDVGGVSDAGGLFLWAGGGALIGSPPPTATLSIPSPVLNDRLGEALNNWQAVLLGDVTGDGRPDVVASAHACDLAGHPDTGGIFVWQGGPGLVGTPAPVATLTVLQNFLHLSDPGSYNGQSLQLVDVSGDGTLDVISGSVQYDSPSRSDVGAVMVWQGGPSLSGFLSNPILLTVSGTEVHTLTESAGHGIQAADFSGDGVLDLVIGCSHASVGGKTSNGAIYLWRGPITTSGNPTLKLWSPTAPDLAQLGG